MEGAERGYLTRTSRFKCLRRRVFDGRLPIKEVARECHLSVSHFSRAFRHSMGVAPHSWLLTRRVEAAKEKLRDDRLTLSDVALACGFADQSHLTRVFTRIVGISPGVWRRALDE